MAASSWDSGLPDFARRSSSALTTLIDRMMCALALPCLPRSLTWRTLSASSLDRGGAGSILFSTFFTFRFPAAAWYFSTRASRNFSRSSSSCSGEQGQERAVLELARLGKRWDGWRGSQGSLPSTAPLQSTGGLGPRGPRATFSCPRGHRPCARDPRWRSCRVGQASQSASTSPRFEECRGREPTQSVDAGRSEMKEEAPLTA